MNIRSTLAIIMAAGLLSGCISLGEGSSPQTRYYTLDSSIDAEQLSLPEGTLLLIGPVDAPEYLNRQNLVSRGDGSQLLFADFDIWSEPVEDAITRVMVQDLSWRLGRDNVLSYSSVVVNPASYQVAVMFYRFDGKLGENVVIESSWRVLDRQGNPVTGPQFFSVEVPAGKDYGSYVSALGRGLNMFADHLAAEISRLAGEAERGKDATGVGSDSAN